MEIKIPDDSPKETADAKSAALDYQQVDPKNIEKAARRIRKSFKGPTKDEATKLHKKCRAIQAGELSGKQTIFSMHEQILLPYLLPWACQQEEMLSFFMASYTGEDGTKKDKIKEFWGSSWQKAVRAFFLYYQDTADFRKLGWVLYKARNEEAEADDQPGNRMYLRLLTDHKDPSLPQQIIRDGLGKALMTDFGLVGKRMLSSNDIFQCGYLYVSLRAFLCGNAEVRQQKQLLEQCLKFLQNRSHIQEGWFRTLFNAWCMSKINLKDIASYNKLSSVQKFKKDKVEELAAQPDLQQEFVFYPDTEKAIQDFQAERERKFEEQRRIYQEQFREKVQRQLLQKRIQDAAEPTVVPSVIEEPSSGSSTGASPVQLGFLRRLWQKIKEFFSWGKH